MGNDKPLTVAEVIEELRTAPPDMYVLGVQGDCGHGLVSGLERDAEGDILVEQAYFEQDGPWMGGNVRPVYKHTKEKERKGRTLYTCVRLLAEAWDPEGPPDDDDTPLDG